MINTVTIGSVTLNEGAYALTGVPGLELPSVRSFSYDLPGEHFGVHTSSLYGRRSFSLQGMVIGSDTDDFIDKRSNLIAALDILSGEQAITFNLSNGTSKRITAILRTLDCAPQSGIPTASPFAIGFEAAFPYLESTTLHAQTTALALPGGGKVPPDTMPAGLNQGSGGAISVTNSGNAPAYPTARITGPVTNPAIRNDSQNAELLFTLTLVSGEYIDIDFKRKTVTDNTGRNRFATVTGTWFRLDPGTTQVRFIASSTDTNAELQLNWRDSYLAL